MRDAGRGRMMDAKTVIEAIIYHYDCTGWENAKSIVKFIKNQEKYAELGRLALVAIDPVNTDESSQPCDEPVFDNSRSCKTCTWKNFCQKRVELLGIGDQKC
jgi:hypothetical protein